MENNRINKRSIYLLLTCIILVVPLISCSRTNSRISRNKILFIELDGASWNVLDALFKEGKLPNIKYLASHGCRASVNTLEPMVSPLIWTSIATGKIPDKHGIMGFTVKQPKSGIEIPVTSNLRKVQAIWNILSYYKKSVGVFGCLVTWPAERVNGCLVSDRAFEVNYLSKGYAYPELNKLCSEAKFKNIQRNALKEKPRMYHDAPDRFILDFALSLSSENKFDFFTIYFSNIDKASHKYWKYMEHRRDLIPSEEILNYEKALNKCKNYIEEEYTFSDMAIGKLLARLLDKDTIVIIASDHGFKPDYNNYASLQTNFDLFLRNGNLTLIKEAGKSIKVDISYWVENLEKRNVRIDRSRLVDEEFYKIREMVKDKLLGIKFSETRLPVFHFICDSETGFVIQSDLLKNKDCHFVFNSRIYSSREYLEDGDSGQHSRQSMLIIYGKHIRNSPLKDVSVFDITPTILYLMGLPVAKDMDGKVLVGAIEDDFLKKNPIRYVDTYETIKSKNPHGDNPVASPYDEDIKSRLRSLGYLN